MDDLWMLSFHAVVSPILKIYCHSIAFDFVTTLLI